MVREAQQEFEVDGATARADIAECLQELHLAGVIA
jgi:hypothetical protein